MKVLSAQSIKELALEMGVDTVGIAPARPVHNGELLREWLAMGYHAKMKYMERNLSVRLNPRELLPEAKSIIAVGVNYFPSMSELAQSEPLFKVAKYAWGEDYHIIVRKILENLRTSLIKLCPGLRGRICVDTAPFMDKYWAQAAGLGWQGKHTNLVSRHFGSWLLLGSLIIDHETDRYDEPHPDHCGTCDACVRACPTAALIAPHQLDAARCISYWTIESKDDKFPDIIKRNMQGWIFGCDLCLNACPFNRFQKPYRLDNFKRRAATAVLEKGDAINLSQIEFDLLTHNSALNRPGLSGIIRNIQATRRIF